MKRYILLLLALLLLLSGCMDVESYLQPPRVQGQQQAVQDALDAALSRGETGAAYTLKYPADGENASAFVMLDESGNVAAQTDVQAAVAFYRPDGGERTHIHLLQLEDGEWNSVADVQGAGVDLHKVKLSDLDGDGYAELLVGWDLYSNDYQLSVYDLKNGLKATPDVGRYTEFIVEDMDGGAPCEMVLLHVGNTVTASVCRWTAQQAVSVDTVKLHKDILNFRRLLFGKLTDGQDGLYVDTQLRGGDYATILLHMRDDKLLTPLYDAAADKFMIPQRVPAIDTMDVDGNNVPDIPVATRLPDSKQTGAAGSWMWLTEWYNWDVTVGAPVRQFGSIVNNTDGYFIELEDGWVETVAVRYDEPTRTLWLYHCDGEEEQPFLAICSSSSAKEADDSHVFESLPGETGLYVWYSDIAPYNLTMEKISYMLVMLR